MKFATIAILVISEFALSIGSGVAANTSALDPGKGHRNQADPRGGAPWVC